MTMPAGANAVQGATRWDGRPALPSGRWSGPHERGSHPPGISQEMIEKTRKRLNQSPTATVGIEEGQALSFPEASVDAVICSLGLMFFPEPARGLASFHGVLRPGRRARSPRSVPIISGSTLSSRGTNPAWPMLSNASSHWATRLGLSRCSVRLGSWSSRPAPRNTPLCHRSTLIMTPSRAAVRPAAITGDHARHSEARRPGRDATSPSTIPAGRSRLT
jgi:SAM-dependent methyltransferase